MDYPGNASVSGDFDKTGEPGEFTHVRLNGRIINILHVRVLRFLYGSNTDSQFGRF